MEDLSNVWCEWVEMELRHDEFQKALAVLHKATYVSDKVLSLCCSRLLVLSSFAVSS